MLPPCLSQALKSEHFSCSPGELGCSLRTLSQGFWCSIGTRPRATLASSGWCFCFWLGISSTENSTPPCPPTLILLMIPSVLQYFLLSLNVCLFSMKSWSRWNQETHYSCSDCISRVCKESHQVTDNKMLLSHWFKKPFWGVGKMAWQLKPLLLM